MKIFTILILAGTIVAYSPAYGSAGRETGNGGDPLALEFLGRAYEAIEKINDFPEKFPEVSTSVLISILDKTEIMVVDEELTSTKGKIKQKSTAINTVNPNRILINRKAWNNITETRVRQSLALHEVLSLAGIEETGVYSIVSRLESMDGRPIHYDNFGQIWKFREPLDEEQMRFNEILPKIPGYERVGQVTTISQRVRFAAKIKGGVKEVSVQVLHYDLDNLKTFESKDFYQIVVMDANDSILFSDRVLGDKNFRVISNQEQRLQIFQLTGNADTQAGLKIIPLDDYGPYFFPFASMRQVDLKDAVSLPNPLETLVLGSLKDGLYGLYMVRLPYAPKLIKTFKSVTPGSEESADAKNPSIEPKPFVSSILGVYKNDRGTYAIVDDLEGIVVVNIETGESKAIYEVPDEGRFSAVLHSKAPRSGAYCTELSLGIYRTDQGKGFYSDINHNSENGGFLPGPNAQPMYTLHMGIVATPKFFTVNLEGCP